MIPCKMNFTLVWLAIMLACLLACVSTDVDGKESTQFYSSLANMEVLFDFDEQLGEVLFQLSEHLHAVTRYLETYMNLQRDRHLSREVRGHPLHVYHLLKRLVLFWPHIAPALQTYATLDQRPCLNLNPECDNWAMRGNCLHYRNYMIKNCALACNVCPAPGIRERVMDVVEKANEMVMPSEDDLRGAANALARLQNTYRIPINNFMAGRIAGTLSSARLSVEDCVRVAAATHYFENYGNAWLWYDYCQASAFLNPRLQEEIKVRRDKVAEEHDMKFVHDDLRFLPRPLRESTAQIPIDWDYSKLCRGAYTETSEELHRLQCHVSSRGSPYLTLQPVRYEQLHHEPEIFLFYDVISQDEINVVKEIAMHKLHRSTTLSASPVVSEHRVSQTAWLKNSSHPALKRVARRIADVTQLFTYEDTLQRQAAEDLQVLNYGLAGHYISHYDTLFKDRPEVQWPKYAEQYPAGDRLATWIFYLNDVIAGGKTVFPKAGAAVTPVKGAAAYWFNLKKNGYFNPNTIHGGCPVLLGQKWVANRWIREHANFLKRPCSTDPSE